MKTPPRTLLFAVAAALAAMGRADGATLLSYWTFNNDATTLNGSTVGTFRTTDSGYGEVYDAASKQLSANTAYGIYSSATINFSGVAGTINGTSTTTTSTNGLGVYADASAGLGASQTSNLYSGDTTALGSQTGSLILLAPASPSNEALVFHLDTAGYQAITLSLADRFGGNPNAPAISWAVSSTGLAGSWTALTPTTTGALANGKSGAFYDTSVAFGSALDNQSSVYLQLSIASLSGSFALDNVQVLGTTLAVPEVPVSGLLGLGGVVAGLARMRCRRVRA